MQFDNLRAYTTGEALAEKRLVKISSSTVVYMTATATDIPAGVTQFAAASGDNVTIKHPHDGGTLEVTAGGAISAGADVYAAANGKVTAVPTAGGTYLRVGVALEAAAADGDIIEILPVLDGKTTTVGG